MLKTYLNPQNDVFRCKGTVFYNDRRRRIDIKKPISGLFSAFGGKSNNIMYSMEFYLDKEKFKRRIEEIMGEGVLPVLLWFGKE